MRRRFRHGDWPDGKGLKRSWDLNRARPGLDEDRVSRCGRDRKHSLGCARAPRARPDRRTVHVQRRLRRAARGARRYGTTVGLDHAPRRQLPAAASMRRGRSRTLSDGTPRFRDRERFRRPTVLIEGGAFGALSPAAMSRLAAPRGRRPAPISWARRCTRSTSRASMLVSPREYGRASSSISRPSSTATAIAHDASSPAISPLSPTTAEAYSC